MTDAPQAPELPLVVHVGFAGSRELIAPDSADPARAEAVEARVAAYLVERLRGLASELGLGVQHRMCGVSQVAVGADQAFGAALEVLGWPHRVFLPQPRDAFLAAVGSQGQPDFPEAAKRRAQAHLDSAWVVQERVVSSSSARTERFLDVNVAIARVSDVVLCVVRADAAAKPGGTHHFLARALARGRPVLEIRVSLGPDGQASFEPTWHQRDRFRAPALPPGLEGVEWPPRDAEGAGTVGVPQAEAPYLPTAQQYGKALKDHASVQAQRHQSRFTRAAGWILGAHLGATAFSLCALGYHTILERHAAPLVAIELLLLALGLRVHQRLHHAHGARAWAVSRLLAEVARSVLAMGGIHAQLDHLFSLPLPPALRALLKTLNVLHLNDTRRGLDPAWESRRQKYLEQRLTDPERGQVAYYASKGAGAQLRARVLGRLFLGCSLLAIVASLVDLGWILADPHRVPPLLGVCAVMFPLLAVGALSLTSALDLEARGHIYAEMVEYLEQQAQHVAAAASEGEFAELALETEAQLLGETASWFARRSFLGVA